MVHAINKRLQKLAFHTAEMSAGKKREKNQYCKWGLYTKSGDIDEVCKSLFETLQGEELGPSVIKENVLYYRVNKKIEEVLPGIIISG